MWLEKIWENMKKVEKYAKNMKEYPVLYRLWDLEKFRDFPSRRLWDLGKIPSIISLYKLWDLKISQASPYTGSGPLYSLWDLEKSLEVRRAKHRTKQGASRVELSPYLKALGLGKISISSPSSLFRLLNFGKFRALPFLSDKAQWLSRQIPLTKTNIKFKLIQDTRIVCRTLKFDSLIIMTHCKCPQR